MTETTADLARAYQRARTVAREHNGKTRRSTAYTLAEFVMVAPAKARKIRQRHVLDWLDQPACCDSTMATKFGTVRAFLRWANATGHIPVDPTFGITGPRRPLRVPRALDPEEVELLFDTAPSKRLLVAEALMACEGLRLSETVGVDLHHIDWRHRSLHVEQGKGAKDRTVHLSPTTAGAVRSYLGEHPVAAGPLLRNEHDHRTRLGANRLGRLISEHMTAVGVKLHPRDGKSPHALRHSYCADLIDEGLTVPEVAQLAGHASYQTTMIYTRHVNLDKTRARVERRRYASR